MIRTIISDLGNVLLHFDHMRSCRRISHACGLMPEQVYRKMFQSGLEKDYDLGRITSEEFSHKIKGVLGCDLDPGLIQQSWQEIFWPVDGMEDLIRTWKGRYQLVLLSNTNEWHFTYCLNTFPFIRLFDYYALSYTLDLRKPDPDIFKEALAMANAQAEESLFIDDIEEYVEAARDQGLHGIRFKDLGQLESELAALGIEVNESD